MVRAGLASFAFLSAFALALTAPVSVDISKGGLIMKAAFAKNGADDPAGHNVGDDRGQNKGRRADDPAGHNAADDHARNKGKGGGADDPAGHR
jgi:hypothetical protein